MLPILITLCLLAGALGGLFTSSSLEGWYASLAKPAWTPPKGVFGPVWTLLYLLMAIAGWLIVRRPSSTLRFTALACFGLQLGLNVIWSFLFFGLSSPSAAFWELLLLWAMILATLVLFFRLDRLAGILFIPYLLWVSFAAVLNYFIWRMNS
jgi:tryptophan-rich sensory protein